MFHDEDIFSKSLSHLLVFLHYLVKKFGNICHSFVWGEGAKGRIWPSESSWPTEPYHFLISPFLCNKVNALIFCRKHTTIKSMAK